MTDPAHETSRDQPPPPRVDSVVLGVIVALGRVALAVPWPVWTAITAAAGWATMLTGRRHVVLANVRHARYGAPPPGPLAWRIGAAQIANHLRTVAGTLRASIRLPDPADFEARGMSNLTPFLDQRGVILVAPHAGPYTTLGIMGRRWLAREGFRGELVIVARMFQPFRSRAVLDWFVRTLAQANVTIVPVDEDPAKLGAILQRTLRNKGIVVLLVDEPTPTPSLTVPFFDSAISMPIGPARLARATGAVIVPVIASYGSRGKQRITIAEPVEPAADPAVTLAQAARALERLIAPRLAQWSMLTPIWRDPAPAPRGCSLAELHLHTPGSDGLLSIEQWREAAAAGVSVIAITDHDHIETVRAWTLANPGGAGGAGGVEVIPGVELTARGRIVHVGVLFTGEVPADLPAMDSPLPEIIRWARGIAGSLVVLVHPHPGLWTRQLRGLERLGLLPDAIETRYPTVGWQARRLEREAARLGLAMLGGSDGHLAAGQLGRHVTVFPGETAADLIAAIRARRTRGATAPAAISVPPRVYLLQSCYSWLLPFRHLPGVPGIRERLLRRAREAAAAAAPRPLGQAERRD
ncbi:MAG: PHP-associated domain-containing protein [Chloroflexota bacterium]